MNEDLYVLGRPARREPRPLPDRLRSLAKLLIAGTTMFLLMSFGGAIYAAPALVPALWWANDNAATKLGHVGITLLACAVMTEVGWALTYISIGETQPFISISPITAFLVTDAAFSLRSARADRMRQPS
jgi:drug/metabolite transporter (DMT)-like permease